MKAVDLLEANGYDLAEDEIYLFEKPSYDGALIGVTDDNRAIYDYEKMIECLEKNEHWTYEEAVEWIEYNVLGFHYNGREPIVMFPLHQNC